MTSVRQIPYEDIELFLLTNDIDPSHDINTNYNIALKLMKNPDTNFEIISIIEWMIAHNLIILNYDIPKYKKSDILNMTDIELSKLAISLTMKKNNIDNILNILFYLDKLVDDIQNNIFYGDPFLNFVNQSDILHKILENLDLYDIINFCVSSDKILNSCKSDMITNLIRDKLELLDTLDLSNFDLQELLFYDKALKFKEYDNLSQFGKFSDIIKDLYNIKSDFIETDKIINIIKFGNKYAIITVTGNCYIYNKTIPDKFTKIDNIYGIIQVVNCYNIDWYLTIEGNIYISSAFNIISDNIIQIKNNILNYKLKPLKNLKNITNLQIENNKLVLYSNYIRYELIIIDINKNKKIVIK